MKTFSQYLKEANSKYIVSKNPNDKKWYVMGHVGNNKWMCENGYAVGYWGQNKEDVEGEHIANRKMLAESGEQELLEG